MVAILPAHLGNSIIGAEEERAIQEVLKTKKLFRYTDHESYSNKVETMIKELLKTPFVSLVINGTAALKASLLALKPTPGDEVVVPGLTFIATATQ